MERVLAEISDPAGVIAVSVRYTFMRALREPLWGQFWSVRDFPPQSVDRGLGRRLLRDIRKGIAGVATCLNHTLAAAQYLMGKFGSSANWTRRRVSPA